EEDDPGDEVPEESYVYLAYDRLASSLSVEDVKDRVRRGQSVGWGPEWRFMGHEQFEAEPMDALGPFQVAMRLVRRPVASEPGYADFLLGVHVKGPTLDQHERPKVVLTFVIDVTQHLEHTLPAPGERHLS